MAQTAKTPNAPTIYDPGVLPEDITDLITTLKNAIGVGKTIYANDMNEIARLINLMNGHYHSYDDAYQLATYGNTGDRTNYIATRFTELADVTTNPNNAGLSTAGTEINAARHNALADAVNVIKTHNHEIVDRYSI